MSRRRNEPPASMSIVSDRFRRILLGAVTALVVARPLVVGEDPGRLRALESTSGQTLNLLWLLVAIAAAIWLTRSPRRFRFGAVPVLLTLIALLGAVSTLVVPCYRHPAWLIVHEWLQLPVIVLLVRELAADEDPAADSAGGLLSAMLASMVSIAAYAGYQAVAPLAGWPSPDLPLVGASGPISSADYFNLHETVAAALGVRGTLERFDTLAALVLLVLPATAGFALFGQGWRAKVAGLVSPLLVAVLVLAIRGYAQGDGAARMTREGIAADLCLERPLWGVGPGNLDRHTPRFVVNANPADLREPADSWVSMAATTGWPAVLVLAAAIVLTIRLAFRGRSDGTLSPPREPASPRWEFYLGGMTGLLAGLVLRIWDFPVSENPRLFLHAGVAAGGRALVWFLAFALFDGLAWRGPSRRFALAAGVVAVALFGTISPALLQPAVSQSLWAVAALALVQPAEFVARGKRNFRWLTIPAACGLAGAYFLLVWDPAFQGASHLRDARRAGRIYASKLYEYRSLSPFDQKLQAKNYRKMVEEMILAHMDRASASDKGNLELIVDHSLWERQYWDDLNADSRIENQALERIRAAHRLDPNGVDSRLAELYLQLTFARLRLKYGTTLPPNVDEKEVQNRMLAHFRAADALIAEIAERAPALESRLRLRLAQALVNAKNDDRAQEAEQQARHILELDEVMPWKLTPAQRALAEKWAKQQPQSD